MAYPQTAGAATPQKPSKTGIIWAIAIFVVTAIIGIVMIVVSIGTIANSISDLQRVNAGQTQQLTLSPGDQYVFVLAPTRAGLNDVRVSIIDPDGDLLVPSDTGNSYSGNSSDGNGDAFRSLGYIDVKTTGTYTVTVDGPPGSSVRIGEIPLGSDPRPAVRRHRHRRPRVHRRPRRAHRGPGAAQQGEEGQPGPRLRRCAGRAPGLRPAADCTRAAGSGPACSSGGRPPPRSAPAGCADPAAAGRADPAPSGRADPAPAGRADPAASGAPTAPPPAAPTAARRPRRRAADRPRPRATSGRTANPVGPEGGAR